MVEQSRLAVLLSRFSPLPERFKSLPLFFPWPQYQLWVGKKYWPSALRRWGHVLCVCDTQSIFLDGEFNTSPLFLYTRFFSILRLQAVWGITL